MTSRRERQLQLQRMKATASTPSSPTFSRKPPPTQPFRRIFSSSTSNSPVASRGSSPTRLQRAPEFRISQVNLLLQSVADDASASTSAQGSQDGINQRDIDLTRHLIHPELYDDVNHGDFGRVVQMSSSPPDRARSMSMSSLTPGMRKPGKDRNFVAAIFHRMNRYRLHYRKIPFKSAQIRSNPLKGEKSAAGEHSPNLHNTTVTQFPSNSSFLP